MPDAKSRFVERILDGNSPDEGKSFTSERQHTAQAFNLHVERRDGRHSEGFAWSHYTGYRWTDDAELERLIVLFGTRAVEIEGHNLGVLVAEIREGQLNSIRELASGQAKLLQQGNPDNQPIITGVNTFPDFDEVLREIKGDDGHDAGFARKIRR
jgi:hypothetical protein